ncbi:uncharacterized protein LOC134527735 isoform X1 [Bacillus rossius redtenbacheri]|uniref:uncharacterized protein LOC134527735 isoform X1 n=1 Tax=Bacillus rossius redtenbacheri TaxID=93214 RepID=UPI002FDCC75F
MSQDVYLEDKTGDNLLVEVVKGYPHLYDCKCYDFKDLRMRENTWQEIAEILHCTAFDCQFRWKRLRERYCREKKLLEVSERSGSCQSFKKEWILMKEVRFLVAHILLRKLNYLGEIRQFYLSFMYQVVEFDTDSGGGVGIIHSKWLTPRKKECFWPPFKHSQQYNKCLSDGQHPCGKWRICALKRKFYITDDILKAREKLKDAEFESDIATEYENESSQKRKKRPNRRILYSSDESSSDEYDTNNQLAHKKYPSPPDVEVAEVPVAECQRSVNTPSNSADSVFTRDSRPSRRSVINSESSSSILCSVENGNTVNTQDVTVSEDSTREQVGLQVIARHLAKIEKRLDVIQQSVSELLKQTLPDTVQNINILPEELTLPCETEEQLNKVEEWISIPENKICMLLLEEINPLATSVMMM